MAIIKLILSTQRIQILRFFLHILIRTKNFIFGFVGYCVSCASNFCDMLFFRVCTRHLILKYIYFIFVCAHIFRIHLDLPFHLSPSLFLHTHTHQGQLLVPFALVCFRFRLLKAITKK